MQPFPKMQKITLVSLLVVLQIFMANQGTLAQWLSVSKAYQEEAKDSKIRNREESAAVAPSGLHD